jgi:membrane protein DedA with SNARE-associated domain
MPPIQHVIEFVQHYGVLAVCFSVLLEFSGLPFPSYPVLMVTGALILHSNTAPLILIAAVATALLADMAWYTAGARLGRALLAFVCRLSFAPKYCMRKTETEFARVGPWALCFIKFVPGIALATIVMAGMTRLKIPRFLAFDAIGSTIYLAVPIVLGRLFRHAIVAMVEGFAHFGMLAAIIIAAALAGFLLYRWVQRTTMAK